MYKRLCIWLFGMLTALMVQAQQVSPVAVYIDDEGNQQETTSIDDGQAPLSVEFRANPSDMGDYTPRFYWHFQRMVQGSGWQNLFVRNDEENTQYTFNESGTYRVMLKTYLEKDGNADELDSVTISVTIVDSKLEMPNAFSPNGDGINDVYKAKEGYKSIVDFHAYIFNRWGQKLFEWTDISTGWDGTFNGHEVKDGVYFVLVKARGGDGREYNIKRDVNLLRGFTEKSGTTGN